MNHKKLLNHTVACLLLLLTSVVSANAQATFFGAHDTQAKNANLATNTIFTMKVTTNHPYVANGDAEFFKSVSEISPCSEFTETSWQRNKPVKIVNGKVEFDSNDLLKVIGPQATCFKAIYTINNKNYSTGDILLTWDESIQSYTRATPAEVAMDFEE